MNSERDYTINPSELIQGDRLGPFMFLHHSKDGYLFYERVGLKFVYLHWQTVKALTKEIGVIHEKEIKSA